MHYLTVAANQGLPAQEFDHNQANLDASTSPVTAQPARAAEAQLEAIANADQHTTWLHYPPQHDWEAS